MNIRALWASVQGWYAAHSDRDRRIIGGVLVAVLLSIVYVGVVEPLVHYRRRVAEEVTEGQEQLERSARFLAAADTLRKERDDLRRQLDEAKQRLLPGDSGTLGAAALQERTNAIAAEKGITVQSTQVMKEEVADPFRKVSIRLTLSGELKPFSEMLAGLEYGAQQLTVPFLEVSRRGAVAGAKGPRTLSATVEVSGYLLGEHAAKPGEGEAGEGEVETLPVPGEGENPPVEGAPAAGAPEAQPGAPVPPADQAAPAAGAPGPPPGESPPVAAAPPPPGEQPPPPAPTPPTGQPPAAAAGTPPPGTPPTLPPPPGPPVLQPGPPPVQPGPPTAALPSVAPPPPPVPAPPVGAPGAAPQRPPGDG